VLSSIPARRKGAADAEGIARVGRENGFDITASDIDALFNQAGARLSEVELDLIAGGNHGGGYFGGGHFGGGGRGH
jgi:hypothetical protein